MHLVIGFEQKTVDSRIKMFLQNSDQNDNNSSLPHAQSFHKANIEVCFETKIPSYQIDH